MNLFRQIPQVDKLINLDVFEGFNKKLLIKKTKLVLQTLKQNIQNGKVVHVEVDKIIEDIKTEYLKVDEELIKSVVNATGVILHTNLGRSILSKELLKKVEHRLTSYSNLEYNLQEGCRGERYSHLKTLFCELFDVEDVLVVNNNASAVFLILNTFAKNREVVVSRGELVEIGGGFRVPEVMRESGAILKEVGTTNKTKIDDYESAINENTAMLLKIHKSNFDIVGFTAEASLEQITTLAKNSDILDYYDLGSAHAISLPYGLKSEPSLHEVLEYKPSLVSFSGDKLFGSVQAGIIVGKSELIKKLKKNQLLRMLRVDKLTITILEESIRAYLKEEYELLPTIKLLLRDEAELLEIAKRIKSGFVNHLEIVKSTTFVGGGTTPNRTIPTIALHVQGEAMSWERIFRANRLIGRVENDKFLIDLRSVEDEQKVIDICKKVFV